MINDSKHLRVFRKYIESGECTKEDLSDLIWLIQHPNYEHRPVDVRIFIDSPEYLGISDECWPVSKDDLAALFAGAHTQAVFVEATGAGKSFKSSIIITYLVYRMLCLKNPAKFYGLATGSKICFMNMSVRESHSKKVVFGEIKTRIDQCKWLSDRYPIDQRVISELRFPKNIRIFPASSKVTAPVGYNVFGGVIDEAAWHLVTPRRDYAAELFGVLSNRIKSRFTTNGLAVLISAPRYEKDFIMRKLVEAKEDNDIFWRHRKLWEAKPEKYFSGRWVEFKGHKIPAEFEKTALSNPEIFMRDFMAMPCGALEPFFKDWNLVKACLTEDTISDIFIRTASAGLMIPFADKFCGKPGRLYYIHVDLGLNKDAAGIALAHAETDGSIYLDYVQRVLPKKNEREIQFSDIRERIYELSDHGFKIEGVTYDGWQSIDSLQILQEKGYNCSTLSIDRTMMPYETLKEIIYTGRFHMYHDSILLQELSELEIINGKKVDHPDMGCFTLDTKVKTNVGKLSFDKLIADYANGYVYKTLSYDYETSSFNWSEIVNPHVTKYTNELIEIEFEDGSVYKCTPDHLFLLNDGITYKKAKELTEEDEIMSL